MTQSDCWLGSWFNGQAAPVLCMAPSPPCHCLPRGWQGAVWLLQLFQQERDRGLSQIWRKGFIYPAGSGTT